MVCLSSVFLIIFIVIWLTNVLYSYLIRRKSVHPKHANKSLQIAAILYGWKPWHRYVPIIANNQSHHYLSSAKYIVFFGIIVNHHQQELKRIVPRLTVSVVKGSCCITVWMNGMDCMYKGTFNYSSLFVEIGCYPLLHVGRSSFGGTTSNIIGKFTVYIGLGSLWYSLMYNIIFMVGNVFNYFEGHPYNTK